MSDDYEHEMSNTPCIINITVLSSAKNIVNKNIIP
jgi:hypothetical protein